MVFHYDILHITKIQLNTQYLSFTFFSFISFISFDLFISSSVIKAISSDSLCSFWLVNSCIIYSLISILMLSIFFVSSIMLYLVYSALTNSFFFIFCLIDIFLLLFIGLFYYLPFPLLFVFLFFNFIYICLFIPVLFSFLKTVFENIFHLFHSSISTLENVFTAYKNVPCKFCKISML